MSSFFSLSRNDERWSEEQWNAVCDRVARSGPLGAFVSNRILRHVTVNAPVILSYVTVCTLLHVLTFWLPGMGRVLGVHDTWNVRRIPLQYTSLVTHIFAHSSFGHLRGNMMHLLLVGPSVEHVFGSRNLLCIVAVVAIASSAAHIWIGSARTYQLGASGVVFACILLNSLVSARDGKIPLAFLLTAALYLGDEVYGMLFAGNKISHHAHLAGGCIGAAAGFYIHKKQRRSETTSVVNKWLKRN